MSAGGWILAGAIVGLVAVLCWLCFIAGYVHSERKGWYR